MAAIQNIVHEQIILLFAGIDDATSVGGKEGLMTWEQVFATSAIGIHDPDAGALDTNVRRNAKHDLLAIWGPGRHFAEAKIDRLAAVGGDFEDAGLVFAGFLPTDFEDDFAAIGGPARDTVAGVAFDPCQARGFPPSASITMILVCGCCANA